MCIYWGFRYFLSLLVVTLQINLFGATSIFRWRRHLTTLWLIGFHFLVVLSFYLFDNFRNCILKGMLNIFLIHSVMNVSLPGTSFVHLNFLIIVLSSFGVIVYVNMDVIVIMVLVPIVCLTWWFIRGFRFVA